MLHDICNNIFDDMRKNCGSKNKPIKFSPKATALQKTPQKKTKQKHKISFPTLTKNIKIQIHGSPLFQGEWYCTNGPRMCIILISDK